MSHRPSPMVGRKDLNFGNSEGQGAGQGIENSEGKERKRRKKNEAEKRKGEENKRRGEKEEKRK